MVIKTINIFFALLTYSIASNAQNPVGYTAEKMDNTAASLNLKNINGFWHFSGPRSYETNNNLSLFWNNGSYQRYLTILDDGKVGIGTSTPESILQLGNSSTANSSSYLTFGKRVSTIEVNLPFIGHDVLVDRNDLGLGTRSTGGGINFYTGNATTAFSQSQIRMSVTADGKVGIGTTAPVDKLHIMDGNLRLSDGNDRMYLRVDNDNSKSQIAFGDDLNDRLDFFFDYWNGTSGDKEVMSLSANGNVGIGTTIPDSKLTVKGDIHAEEVKVDLSVPGPDYVFKEDYDLKSLEEVQNHIKKHGHLPNIPSAQEMEENGIQLGEMNMKLLEKIEELTLYALEQEEKIVHQEEQINQLKMENKEMVEIESRLQKIEQQLNLKK
ncbi:MAG: hypothetical protein ABJN84_03520 [Flavobacteriaceae bacterium]